MVEMNKMSWITQKFPIYIDRGHFGPNRPISKMLRQDAKFLPHSQHFKQSQRLVKSSLYLPQVGDWKNDIAMICSFFLFVYVQMLCIVLKEAKMFWSEKQNQISKVFATNILRNCAKATLAQNHFVWLLFHWKRITWMLMYKC